MRKWKLLAIGAAAAVLVTGLIAVANSSASAAPTGAAVQSDYARCSFTTDSAGLITCPLTDPVDLSADAVSFATITAPTGGAVNLPASVRRQRFIVDEPTGTRITAVQWRIFGHQLVRDPNGNFRQAVYANLPVSLDQKVTVKGSAYCAANPCS
jgi:hypothetical protein